MISTATTTSYVRLSPWQSRGVLIAVAVLIGLAWWASPPRAVLCDVHDEKSGRLGDIFLYKAEVDRIRAGEGYYQAAAEELPTRNYPTASVFNWRTPLPMWLIGRLPDPLARWLLIAAGISAMLMAYLAAKREQPNRLRMAIPLVLLLTWSMFPCLQGDLYMLAEIWAGVLFALSLAAYGVSAASWRGGGAGGALRAGLDAPLLPAGPAPGPSAAAAEGDNGLFRGSDGLGCFLRAALLGGQPLDRAGALSHQHGWVRFGGLSFVLVLTQANAVLVTMPVWITVIFFTLAMVGFAGWQTDWGRRLALTAAIYVAAFSIVGQEFNNYWGHMIAPLFCFGVVRSRGALADLWRAAKLPTWVVWPASGCGRWPFGERYHGTRDSLRPKNTGMA